jgi:Ca2+-transporting ATPase
MSDGLEHTADRGLSEAEAARRLAADGPNELPSDKKKNWTRLVWEVVHEPMFLMLLACGSIYLLLGDPAEASMLLGFVAVVIGITLYQEHKTERALAALRDLSSPRALVIRDGRRVRIAGRDVVRDDLLIVSEGDRVAADAAVLSARNLSADESLLTGESVPVEKGCWDGVQAVGRPGGEGQPFLYAGTLITRGRGVARVLSTGPQTQMGLIGKSLLTLEVEGTPLQRQTGKIVRNFALVGLSLCVLIIGIFGLTRGDWLNGLLAGLTLAMATLPEEFPVVLTVFFALGAWRISRRNVLTRRIPAVETLGAATALCVDKTGTLTLNQMRVTQLVAGDEGWTADGPQETPSGPQAEVIRYGLLASSRDTFDPMEKAIKETAKTVSPGWGPGTEGWTLVREYPHSGKLMAVIRAWRVPSESRLVIGGKGAPEAIAKLCRLDPSRLREVEDRVARMAEEGLRVLAVARAQAPDDRLPDDPHQIDMEFVGLLGLSDPVRPGVPDAVHECRRAGIKVIMITGDYPGTALAIGRQIGLGKDAGIITGPELDGMTDDALKSRVGSTSIFARVVPEQKLRIVQALKANGEVVAMTGDGVNDAPALKAANIGIAMGGRGTDVAREAAALVLLDDNFASIVQAIRLGRRIFDNLRKAMTFIFSVHIPIAGLSLVPVLLNWPLALMPVHIAFLELIIDPACSLVFEGERDESDIMRRPPRRLGDPLFGKPMVIAGLIQGAGVLVAVLAVYGLILGLGWGEGEARMIAFISLVLANLGLILSNRSGRRPIAQILRKPNKAFWGVIIGAAAFLALVVSFPFLRNLFHFDVLHPWQLVLAFGAAIASLAITEASKVLLKY